MKIVATAPISRAAHATACPWLPALAATTPAARSASPSCEILLYAPRTLNDPVRCRFSALRKTSRPVIRVRVSERLIGVTRATPSSRRCAARMSGRPGAVALLTNVEHLVEDLPHRRQRIELAPLHLVEQSQQLRIVGDCVLEMLLRPRRRDGEDLAGEVLATPLLEAAALLEVCAVCIDLLPELGHVLAAHGVGEDDRRLPFALVVE